MVKKIRAQIFGLCIGKIEAKDLRKPSNQRSLLEDFDLQSSLDQPTVNLSKEEQEWQSKLEKTEAAINRLRRGGEDSLKFMNIEMKEVSNLKVILLVLLCLVVPIYGVWTCLFQEKQKPKKKKRKQGSGEEKKNS